MVSRSTTYINGKESFLLLFLYHHVFPHLLQYFTKQYQSTWQEATRNIAEVWGVAAALAPTRGSSKVMPGWAHCSEDKEGGGGKNKGGSREEKSCRRGGKEEEDIGVSPTTLEWGTRGRSCPFGGHWRVPGHRIQVQRGHLQRWEETMAFQES